MSEAVESDAWARFKRLVIDPLNRFGFRRPSHYTELEWTRALDELAEELSGRSAVELTALCKALKEKGGGSKRDIWPSPAVIKGVADEVYREHLAATGGNAELDRRAVARALSWMETHGEFPPEPYFEFRGRLSRFHALFSVQGAPTVRQVEDAGHKVPRDVADRYA